MSSLCSVSPQSCSRCASSPNGWLTETSWTSPRSTPRSTVFVSYALFCFLPQSSNPETSLKLAEAASGLQYLHSMDIVHSDLKPVRATNYSYRPPLTIPRRRTSSSTAISIPVSPTTGLLRSYQTRTPSILVVRRLPLLEPFGTWRQNC